jgi:hypothetical protein
MLNITSARTVIVVLRSIVGSALPELRVEGGEESIQLTSGAPGDGRLSVNWSFVREQNGTEPGADKSTTRLAPIMTPPRWIGWIGSLQRGRLEGTSF